MRYRSSALALFFIVTTSIVARAQNIDNGFEVVRIADTSNFKCINSKTDQITLSVFRVIIQKKGGLFTKDNQAGIAVLATVNGSAIQLNAPSQSGPTSATTPQVSLLQIGQEKNGQVLSQESRLSRVVRS